MEHNLAAGRGSILLYVDGSDTCITAAQYAVYLARAFSKPLVALYVVDAKVLGDLVKARIFVQSEASDYEYDLREDGRRYLSYVEHLATAKGVHCDTEIVTGEVNVEVVKKARDIDAELVVLNELEPHGSRRDAYLDEKERVLRRVGCTLVVVKDEERVARLYEAM